MGNRARRHCPEGMSWVVTGLAREFGARVWGTAAINPLNPLVVWLDGRA